MPAQHLVPLYNRYASILRTFAVGEDFDSHIFILRLAQKHQSEYIMALDYYRRKRDPFRQLHNQLSRLIGKHPALARRLRPNRISADIFGDKVSNAAWRRI
jgi:hypothetical protein